MTALHDTTAEYWCPRGMHTVPESAFGRTRDGRRQGYCRACHKSYSREYHSQHYTPAGPRRIKVATLTERQTTLLMFVGSRESVITADMVRSGIYGGQDDETRAGNVRIAVGILVRRGFVSRRLDAHIRPRFRWEITARGVAWLMMRGMA